MLAIPEPMETRPGRWLSPALDASRQRSLPQIGNSLSHRSCRCCTGSPLTMADCEKNRNLIVAGTEHSRRGAATRTHAHGILGHLAAGPVGIRLSSHKLLALSSSRYLITFASTGKLLLLGLECVNCLSVRLNREEKPGPQSTGDLLRHRACRGPGGQSGVGPSMLLVGFPARHATSSNITASSSRP